MNSCFSNPAKPLKGVDPNLLVLETLESRFHLSGSIQLDPATGVITITGTNGPDQAFVDRVGQTAIRISLNVTVVEQFAISAVSRIDFFGYDGNDVFANRSDEYSNVYGGDGNDQLSGGYKEDYVWGGYGDDQIWGLGGLDVLKGGSGNDRMFGGAAADQIFGDDGHDVADGEAGHDLIYGSDGNDLLRGGIGQDVIRGGVGDDQIHGDENNDSLWGESGYDAINGEAGNDAIWGGDNNDELNGGAGSDTIRGDDGSDEIHGQSENDTLWGGTGADQIFGWDGDDLLRGELNDDELHGGPGEDLIYGDQGNDSLFGDTHVDRLFGGDGNDRLLGGADYVDDFLRGDGGLDRFLVVGTDGAADVTHVDAKLVFLRGNVNWTSAEVEILDQGFQALYELTGNNRLLRDPLDVTGLKFRKYSALGGGAVSINRLNTVTVNGKSTYTRYIDVADWNENDTWMNEVMTRTVVHEAGHSWDSTKELGAVATGLVGIWNTFLSRSGWRQNTPSNPSLYYRSLDGKWWYLKTAEFAREYGRANPYEDWSTVWEQVAFPSNAKVGSVLQTKINTVRSLFNAVAG